MSDQLHEQISAFVDGELPEHETELLLRRLDREPELKATLARYVAIGASLRSDGGVRLSTRLATRVAAAIASEQPGEHRSRRRLPVRWLRPLGGIAVAATVAAIAILGAQRLMLGGGEDAAVTVADTQPARSLEANPVIGLPDAADEPYSYIVPPASSGVTPLPAARLTNYVVAHSEYSSPLGRRNVLSGVIAEDPEPLQQPEATPASTSPAPVP